MVLVEAEGATLVKVTGQGQVGGLMARVGQRLLSTASKMMMDRFFCCLQAKATPVTLPGGSPCGGAPDGAPAVD